MKLHEHAHRQFHFSQFPKYPVTVVLPRRFETRHVLPVMVYLALRIVHTRSPCGNCIADCNVNIVSRTTAERTTSRSESLPAYIPSAPSRCHHCRRLLVVASVSHRLYLASRRGTRARKSRQVC